MSQTHKPLCTHTTLHDVTLIFGTIFVTHLAKIGAEDSEKQTHTLTHTKLRSKIYSVYFTSKLLTRLSVVYHNHNHNHEHHKPSTRLVNRPLALAEAPPHPRKPHGIGGDCKRAASNTPVNRRNLLPIARAISWWTDR